MGAWGHTSFENDDAMDWLGELEGAADTEPIADAFAAVLEADNYLEAPEASMGLAAAEVVAAMLGAPAATLPAEVAGWATGKTAPKAALVKQARRVVKRVLEDSELQELWAESPESAQWQEEVAGLLQRLGDKPA